MVLVLVLPENCLALKVLFKFVTLYLYKSNKFIVLPPSALLLNDFIILSCELLHFL